MKKVILKIILPLLLLGCMIGFAWYLVYLRAKPEAKNITRKAPLRRDHHCPSRGFTINRLDLRHRSAKNPNRLVGRSAWHY